MGYLSERVSYLRGMADGLNIDKETDTGKLLSLIIDVLDDIAISVEDNEDTQNELLDSMDDVEERISYVEECLDDEDGCCCGEDDEDVSYGELECPHCGAEIELDKAAIDEDKNVITCPNCHNDIEIEWTDDCECKDDECCCHHHDEE